MLKTTEFHQQFAANGMEEMLCGEIACQLLHLGQSCLRTGYIEQGDRPVQSHNGRGYYAQQEIIEDQNLWPIGHLLGCSFCMTGG